MSGHSKWSTIKRKKAVEDAKRGKIFTKVARGITVSAKKGGGDPDSNPGLRAAIEKARQVRMPNDNIERAIQRGVGGGEGSNLEEIRYEGYGPEGVAVLLICLTDNKNRTVSEIRNIFEKSGGSLGETGSASYVFGDDLSNPKFNITVGEPSSAKRVLSLVNELDEHDDVQEVYANFDIPEELLLLL